MLVQSPAPAKTPRTLPRGTLSPPCPWLLGGPSPCLCILIFTAILRICPLVLGLCVSVPSCPHNCPCTCLHQLFITLSVAWSLSLCFPASLSFLPSSLPLSWFPIQCISVSHLCSNLSGSPPTLFLLPCFLSLLLFSISQALPASHVSVSVAPCSSPSPRVPSTDQWGKEVKVSMSYDHRK